MTIYLYVKTHNKTGLKYLGYTKTDPYHYQGSGIYWTKHIEKHGYDVITEVLFQTNDKTEMKAMGIPFETITALTGLSKDEIKKL
jgi:hypothetical protein